MSKWTNPTTKEKLEIYKKTNPITGSGLAVNGQCAFHGIMIKTDGTNNLALTLYDNVSAAGAPLIPDSIVVLGSARVTKYEFNKPIIAQNGIFVSGTCAGLWTWQVYYDK